MLPVACVGEQVYAVACFLQLAYKLRHAGDGQNRPVPAVDQQVRLLVQPLGEAAAHARGGFLLGHGAAIHLRPFEREIDVVHKRPPVRGLHADGVKEIVPVELQQDIAHVKNDVFYHQTIFTLPFVARNTMTSEIIVVRVSMVASAAAVPSLMRTTS